MQYILASAGEEHIHWMHTKIYFNEKQAVNALNVMIENGKVYEDTTVFQVTDWLLKKVEVSERDERPKVIKRTNK